MSRAFDPAPALPESRQLTLTLAVSVHPLTMKKMRNMSRTPLIQIVLGLIVAVVYFALTPPRSATAAGHRPVITYNVASDTSNSDNLQLQAMVKYATSVSFVYQKRIHRASYAGSSPLGPVWNWKSKQTYVLGRCYSYRIIARNHSGVSRKTIKAGPGGRYPCNPGV